MRLPEGLPSTLYDQQWTTDFGDRSFFNQPFDA